MVVVKEEICVGCGLCFPFCPNEAITVWGVAKVDNDECIECLECIDYCPVDALEVE